MLLHHSLQYPVEAIATFLCQKCPALSFKSCHTITLLSPFDFCSLRSAHLCRLLRSTYHSCLNDYSGCHQETSDEHFCRKCANVNASICPSGYGFEAAVAGSSILSLS